MPSMSVRTNRRVTGTGRTFRVLSLTFKLLALPVLPSVLAILARLSLLALQALLFLKPGIRP